MRRYPVGDFPPDDDRNPQTSLPMTLLTAIRETATAYTRRMSAFHPDTPGTDTRLIAVYAMYQHELCSLVREYRGWKRSDDACRIIHDRINKLTRKGECTR